MQQVILVKFFACVLLCAMACARPMNGTDTVAETTDFSTEQPFSFNETRSTRAQQLIDRLRRDPSASTQLYTGVWRQSGTDSMFVLDLDYTAFIAFWNAASATGWRLDDLETKLIDSTRVYSGVFRVGAGAYGLWIGTTWADFTAKWDEWSKAGLRLIDIETYMVGATRRYAGVFRAGTGGYGLWSSSYASFLAQRATWAASGVYLSDIEVYTTGLITTYLGVFNSNGLADTLIIKSSFAAFVLEWSAQAALGRRLVDYEVSSVPTGTQYTGIFVAGADGYTLWANVDEESFRGMDYSAKLGGQYLVDLEESYSSCPAECANNVIADSSYVYRITGTLVADTMRWPVIESGGKRFVRHSALQFNTSPNLYLPFSDPAVSQGSGWRYSSLGYHHALDYSRGDPTFVVRAMKAGTVKFVGWDNWSGNTIILSHDGDTWRTVYMHLRNGKTADCAKAWAKTVPALTVGSDSYNEYLAYLGNSGCNKDSQVPDETYWGTNAQAIPVVQGQVVAKGQFIAYAGNTGPGGKRGDSLSVNTHLHLFTLRKDTTDGRWYFIDPYGIYAQTQCYPPGITDAIATPCSRYPIAWKDKKPQY